MTRAKIAFAVGVAFLVLAVVVPSSSGYLATVGWVMLIVVEPLFYLLARRRAG